MFGSLECLENFSVILVFVLMWIWGLVPGIGCDFSRLKCKMI